MQALSDQAKDTQKCYKSEDKNNGSSFYPLNVPGSQEKILNVRNYCFMEPAVRKDSTVQNLLKNINVTFPQNLIVT